MTTNDELTRSEHRQRMVRRPVFRCPTCGQELHREPWCRRCMPAYMNPPISRPLAGMKVA